jgi:hypothetical protein
LLIDRSEGKEVILCQKIITFGCKGGYKTVFVEPSAVVTERVKPVEKRVSFMFYAMAVTPAVGTQASQEFVEGLLFFFAGEIDVETGTKKKEPESIIGYKGVAEAVIDLSKGQEMADAKVRHYVFEDKDREGVEFHRRRWSI